ncbi:hypothetical protein [Streptomyces mirabilis]|uniref:hypothetical protein n=1 Tax=Streptomyces mirabilis TaxID=68239 RepID=UPI0036BF5B58
MSILDKQLRRIVWRDHARTLEATLQERSLPSGRVRQLGRWFTMRGEHPNAVQFGMLLLGMAGTDHDSEILKTLGTFWEFSAEACEALLRSQADPYRALFELAQQAEGWARGDAVRRLEGASDPEIREWLIRESCTGDVLDSYFALTAAKVGDLADVLSRESLDEASLDGAGRLLEALADVDGPGPALGAYDDAVRALTNGAGAHPRGKPTFLAVASPATDVVGPGALDEVRPVRRVVDAGPGKRGEDLLMKRQRSDPAPFRPLHNQVARLGCRRPAWNKVRASSAKVRRCLSDSPLRALKAQSTSRCLQLAPSYWQLLRARAGGGMIRR